MFFGWRFGLLSLCDLLWRYFTPPQECGNNLPIQPKLRRSIHSIIGKKNAMKGLVSGNNKKIRMFLMLTRRQGQLPTLPVEIIRDIAKQFYIENCAPGVYFDDVFTLMHPPQRKLTIDNALC